MRRFRSLSIVLLSIPLVAARCEYQSAQYFEELEQRISSAEPPDVGYIESFHAPELIANDALQEIGRIVEPSDFYPIALDSFRGPDDAIYGIPRDIQTVTLLYRNDMVGNPPSDWQGLIDIGAEFGATPGLPPLALTAEMWNFLPFLYQAGGTLVDGDGQPQLDSPQALEAMTFYSELVLSGAAVVPEAGLNPTPENFPYGAHEEAVDLLLAGDVAMILAPNNVLEATKAEGLSEIAAAPIPAGPSGPATIAYVTGLAAYVEVDEATEQYLIAGTSEDAQRRWFDSLQFMPTRPALRAEYVDLHPEAAVFVEAIDYSFVWQPKNATFDGIRNFDEASRVPLAAAVSGQITPEEALDQLQGLASEFLSG